MRSHKGEKLKGLWLNEVFLKTFALHYNQISGTRRVDAFGNPKLLHPVGAAGLCAASVTQMLLIFVTSRLIGLVYRLSEPTSFGPPKQSPLIISITPYQAASLSPPKTFAKRSGQTRSYLPLSSVMLHVVDTKPITLTLQQKSRMPSGM